MDTQKDVSFYELAYGDFFLYNKKLYLKTTPSVLTPEFTGNCVDLEAGRHWQLGLKTQVKKVILVPFIN